MHGARGARAIPLVVDRVGKPDEPIERIEPAFREPVHHRSLHHRVNELSCVGEIDLHHVAEPQGQEALEALRIERLITPPGVFGDPAELAEAAGRLLLVTVEITEHGRLLEERLVARQQILGRRPAEFGCGQPLVGLDQPDGILHAAFVAFDKPGIGQDVDSIGERVEFDAAAPHQVLEIAQPRADDRQLVEAMAVERVLPERDPLLRPVDAVGMRMRPVEGPELLHLREHEGRVHVVAVDEHPLLKVRHDPLEDGGCQPLVLEKCRNQRAIRAGGQRLAGEQLRVDRIRVQDHPAQHPQKLLVGPFAMLGQKGECVLHVGVVEVGEHVRGSGDLPKPLDRFGRGPPAGRVAEEFAKFAGQPHLVIPVLTIILAADFVEEDPGELHRKVGVVGIEHDPLGAQQIDASVHPSPPLFGHLRADGDVVGEIPGLKAPHLRKPGLQRRDPLAQGLSLEKLPLRLQRVGPHPEHVHRQPAKRAQCRGGKRDVRRHPLRAFRRHHEPEFFPLRGDRPGHEAGPGEAGHEHGRRHDFGHPIAHRRGSSAMLMSTTESDHDDRTRPSRAGR